MRFTPRFLPWNGNYDNVAAIADGLLFVTVMASADSCEGNC
jgi:hypothetical protein